MRNDIPTNNQEKLEYALKGLYDVYDPEVGLNVVDLGLIYEIYFYEEEEKMVSTLMTLTTQFCPMGEAITNDVTESLTQAFPGYKINVELTFDPAWDYTKITPEGKEFLGQ
ncbi:metal-sulfur cluster assembly factor [Elizabethkingia sp. JS20170427COW]|uniref:metal-sulfur cluster assembly factor n=1 Tax=Elizabethkingia sp. JS20170427COW TaxID=2583851 RepID=UPI0011106E45|nr:metal-sulfur cluster assembly factor [Elizabethkingia sp. JS20170427COW]QCX52302.1 metal-sulfur cluster assembly factor [Elizabethkingia sp. JS20170427COW]